MSSHAWTCKIIDAITSMKLEVSADKIHKLTLGECPGMPSLHKSYVLHRALFKIEIRLLIEGSSTTALEHHEANRQVARSTGVACNMYTVMQA